MIRVHKKADKRKPKLEDFVALRNAFEKYFKSEVLSQ